MDTTIRCLEKLGKAFEKFYFFAGNHDLYYKDKRDVYSVEFGKHIPGITLINNIYEEDDVALIPWLVGDEWKKIEKLKAKYLFGHFELPSFYMNAMVQMPDHGQLQADDFINQEYVFSGHFHKRQTKGNITYMGNAFPHNYADAWDDERGMMILEWGGVPEYKSWPDQPLYRTFKLSKLLEAPDDMLKEKMHCRVTIDVPISFEEANFIKETFMPQYNLRELMLIPEKTEIEGQDVQPVDLKFESVDTIVVNQITNIDSEQYDQQLLLEIYNNL
jgi:hypothetical protein